MSVKFYREVVTVTSGTPDADLLHNPNLIKLDVRCGRHTASEHGMTFIGLHETEEDSMPVLVCEYLCALCGNVRRFAHDSDHGVRELPPRKAPVGIAPRH